MKADHVNAFIGATVDHNPVVVMAYCGKGSIKDILDNEDIKLDSMFITSFLIDIVRVSIRQIATLFTFSFLSWIIVSEGVYIRGV